MDPIYGDLPLLAHEGEWRYFRVVSRFIKDSRRDEMEWLVTNWFGDEEGKAIGTSSTTETARNEKEAALRKELFPVEWLPYRIYRIPKHVFISQSPLHREGKIVGMDAASVASVMALGVEAGQSVLDVCCCPGMKLSLISELIQETANGHQTDAHREGSNLHTSTPPQSSGGGGIAVGVDISLNRLFVARSLMSKLCVSRTVLCHCDGTQFDPGHLAVDLSARRTPARQKAYLQRLAQRLSEGNSTTADHTTSAATSVWCSDDLQRLLVETGHAQKRERALVKADATLRQDDEEIAEKQPSLPFCMPTLFDRVLVDAECTHDGSLHHIVKQENSIEKGAEGTAALSSTRTALPSFQDKLHVYKPNYALHTEEADSALHDLQLSLLERGFALTRPGGIVVYSTCSFSEGQNESIVRKFLAKYGASRPATGHGGEGKSEKEPKPIAILLDPFLDYSSCTCAVEGSGALTDGVGTDVCSEMQQCLGCHLKAVTDIGVEGLGVRMNPSKTKSSFQYIAKFRKELLLS